MSTGQPIQTGDSKMEAHLIEARSIGGISGSPTFVRQTISVGFGDPKHFGEHELYKQLTPEEMRKMKDTLFLSGIGPFFLLGLTQGHWDISSSQKNQNQIVEDLGGEVNMGIALVVPATKILDTINHPELVEMRREIYEAEKKKLPKPKLDKLNPTEQMTPKGATIAIPTRDSFMRDLAKATRRRKPS
jgi:hypothetical protein